jgi:ABC-type amino acid transport substrate-binding protein
MKQLASSKLDEQVKSDVMLLKLLEDRVDVAVISPVEGVSIAARAANIPMSQLSVAKEPLAVVANHIVACKSDPSYGDLLRKLDKSIAKLKANGEIDRIMKKYAAAN